MQAPVSSDWLELHEAIDLGYALADHVARSLSIRCLAIKGPVLATQGLRSGHSSVDVDVLVDPRERDRLLTALNHRGWRVPVEPTSAQVLPLHSTTLRHPMWPNELDVHDRFPGFLAPHQDVFEELWRRRTTVMLAHRQIECPDPMSHAAIAALHWLRDGEELAQHRVTALAETVRPRMGDERDREALRELVVRTGSAETLHPFLDRLGLAVPMGPYDATDWRIRTASTGVMGVGWVLELRRTPLHRWPRRLWHALVLTEAEIRNSQPGAGPGRLGLTAARTRRLGRGLRDLPRALHLVWREGRR